MINLKTILIRVSLILIGILLLFSIITMAFINIAPQFGATPTGAHLERIKLSPNYRDGQFVNLVETKMDYSAGNVWRMLKEGISSKNTSPVQVIQTKFGSPAVSAGDSLLQVTWFGHSAILLEVDGLRIFLDPMLGPAASPVPWFGKRFKNDPAGQLSAIGPIDAVIMSHDHYDHLDYPSIMALKDQVAHFYTPLGLGAHLRAWGVDTSRITELDWWESVSMGDFVFTAAPARHFSGRGIRDGNKTLWASWVIKGKNQTLYFSGDSGYGPHFKEIGDRFGPFDFTMMECGQYNARWEPIHMMPEQTAQAHLDLRGSILMPIHWGAFSLAPHPWIEPAERLTAAAEKNGIRLITPVIGARFVLSGDLPVTPWWQRVN